MASIVVIKFPTDFAKAAFLRAAGEGKILEAMKAASPEVPQVQNLHTTHVNYDDFEGDEDIKQVDVKIEFT